MQSEANTAAPAAPAPAQAVAGVIITVVVVALKLVIGTTLRIPALCMVFLFATYWGSIRHLALADWMPSAVGGLAGIGLAWLLHVLPAAHGLPGVLLALAPTLVAIYFLIRRKLALLINPSFLLFLTVATIPSQATTVSHAGMAMGMLFGAAYAGGLTLLVQRLAARRTATTLLSERALT